MSEIFAYMKSISIALDDDVTVLQFPYRTASVNNRFMEMKIGHRDDIELRSMMRTFESQLAERAEARVDNHTVYEITMAERNRLYVMFHDDYVFFGLSVHKGRW